MTTSIETGFYYFPDRQSSASGCDNSDNDPRN